jgi:hypothetical protein
MPYQYVDYPAQARRLADAGDGLLEAITDPEIDKGIVIVELETASSGVPSGELRFRFDPAEAAPEIPKSPEDILSGLLLDLQAANTLMAAGVAMNEHGKGNDPQYLRDTVAQIRDAGSEVDTHLAASTRLRFAPQAQPSTTVDDAVKLFRVSAGRTLDAVAGGTEGVINSAFSKLKDLDKSKVSEAFANLGKSFEVVAAAGNLIRRGLQKLNEVLNSLSSLFGSSVMDQVKSKAKEVWDKFISGEYTRSLVNFLIGVPEVEDRVDKFAALPAAQIGVYDGVSRELALLEDQYQGKRKILNGLISAVVLAMGIIAALELFGLWAATPWIALAAAGAYAGIIGAALLVGMNYTGARPLFGWSRGVCELVQDPRPPQAA